MELFPQERTEEDDHSQVSLQTRKRALYNEILTDSKPVALSMKSQLEFALSQVRGMGLVVVRDSKVVGLHCSGPELHAGQAAIIQHGSCLNDCQLYFSRRPCATCLKMIINGEERGRD